MTLKSRVKKLNIQGIIFALSLIMQSFFQPMSVQGSTPTGPNPPPEVIAQKLENIAREKGIPSIILKAIAFKESSWRQWDIQGNPVLGGSSTHPAIGIMQVASYSDSDTETIQKLKNDIDFNIRMGADILNQKWEMVPKIGDGDRNKLENWYFALWAYNSWSGKNNPNQAAVAASSTTSATTSQPALPSSTTPQTYQDKVLELCANPPAILAGFIKPVTVSKISPSSLPKEGVPSASVKWETPQPVHWGDLLPSKVLTLIRLAGNDRIETAIRQAYIGWPNGAPAVILARADDFPDALAGVPLAAQFNAPVLLTPPMKLDARLEEALRKLSPEKIYLLGGEGAISRSISTRLKELGWDNTKQVRLGGNNRFATASSIAQAMNGPFPAVVVVTGHNFPDALSIASIAGQQRMPILLTDTSSLPPETLSTLKNLKPSKVYLVGGEGVISRIVEEGIRTALGLPDSSVIRLAGGNRYATMAQVAKTFATNAKTFAFATGEDFPDALAGAALAVKQNAMVILLPPTSLNEYLELKGFIAGHLNSAETYFLFGGEGAISATREEELRALAL